MFISKHVRVIVRIFRLLDLKVSLSHGPYLSIFIFTRSSPTFSQQFKYNVFLTKASGNRKYSNFMEQNGRELPETQFAPGFNIDTQTPSCFCACITQQQIAVNPSLEYPQTEWLLPHAGPSSAVTQFRAQKHPCLQQAHLGTDCCTAPPDVPFPSLTPAQKLNLHKPKLVNENH